MIKISVNALVLLFCLGLSRCGNKTNDVSVLPNIILFMADDQRWGDMAYNSHPLLQTPNFESVAKESLRFDDFYAAARICSTTHGSVLTGRYPNRFACFMWRNTLSPQVVTIAEVLKKAGYSTGHFGSGRKGSSVNPSAGGFNEWSCCMVGLAMEIT